MFVCQFVVFSRQSRCAAQVSLLVDSSARLHARSCSQKLTWKELQVATPPSPAPELGPIPGTNSAAALRRRTKATSGVGECRVSRRQCPSLDISSRLLSLVSARPSSTGRLVTSPPRVKPSLYVPPALPAHQDDDDDLVVPKVKREPLSAALSAPCPLDSHKHACAVPSPLRLRVPYVELGAPDRPIKPSLWQPLAHAIPPAAVAAVSSRGMCISGSRLRSCRLSVLAVMAASFHCSAVHTRTAMLLNTSKNPPCCLPRLLIMFDGRRLYYCLTARKQL